MTYKVIRNTCFSRIVIAQFDSEAEALRYAADDYTLVVVKD